MLLSDHARVEALVRELHDRYPCHMFRSNLQSILANRMPPIQECANRQGYQWWFWSLHNVVRQALRKPLYPIGFKHAWLQEETLHVGATGVLSWERTILPLLRIDVEANLARAIDERCIHWVTSLRRLTRLGELSPPPLIGTRASTRTNPEVGA